MPLILGTSKMSSTKVPPWQNVLDSLTKKASEWNILHSLKRDDELTTVEQCLGHESLRSYLSEWMEMCLKNNAAKSSAVSSAFRSQGNEEFKRCHDTASLSLYTDAIRFAPYGSEEHALGLANRSAVLFHMRKYRECVSDAESALSLPYPSRLRFKLMLRQARSFLHLNEWDKCEFILQLAIKDLSDGSLSDSDGLKKEIQTIQSELCEMRESKTSILDKETSEESLPDLLRGTNSKLPFASAALELRYSEHQGRHIFTNQDIQQGDVLFIEKPYTFVILPEQFKAHCHHCSQPLLAPVPCSKCVDVLFCNENCKTSSITGYHHWECGGISLMSAVGIAHLGLRIILATGDPANILNRASAASQHFHSDKGSVGNLEDPYSPVYSLLPHLEDMSPEDIFQYTATAELLTLYLVQKTDYFKNIPLEPVAFKDDAVIKVCALLLRHIAQLVCNAHAITKLESQPSLPSEPVKTLNSVVSESQQRIATAIYPSASMMNHSCDPNIINSFSNEVLIVKASRNIRKGEEVFNCYGPHFQRMGTAERQAALQAQYFFFCKCSACASNQGESFDPIQERLWALKCASCSGPLLYEAHGREPAGSKVTQSDSQNSHIMVCETCGSHQPISNLVCDAFSALSLFKKGCEEMENGRMQGALNNLNRCRELQERALYRTNKDLTATYDMLAKCYATLGQYSQSIKLLKLTLPAVEEQFGTNSVEVANELQKLSDVMLCDIRTMETVPSREMLDDASQVVERARSILSVHYGKWNQGWQDLEKKFKELKLMEEMATL